MGRYSVQYDSEDDTDLSQNDGHNGQLISSHVPDCDTNNNGTRNPQDQLFRNHSFHCNYSLQEQNGSGFLVESRSRDKSISYRKQFFLLLFLILFKHYIPPPPSPFDDWIEYVQHSTNGIKSVAANCFSLLYYISTGAFHNMKEDGREVLQRLWKRDIAVDHHCPIGIPASNSTFNSKGIMMDHFQRNIFGQDHAIDTILGALESMYIGEHTVDEKKKSKPFTMMFTGSEGVGKSHISREIIKTLLQPCSIEQFRQHEHCIHTLSNICQHKVLELNGLDFALDGNDKSGTYTGLGMIQQILDHLQRQDGAGGIILIRHVENVSLQAKLELVRLLTKESVSFTPSVVTSTVKKESTFISDFYEKLVVGMNIDAMEEKQETIVRLDNSIFLFTTDIGTDKIFSGIQRHETHRQIQQKVQRDIDTVFGKRVLDHVIPQLPLQYKDMKSIVKHKFEQLEISDKVITRIPIEIEPVAIDYLSGPTNVEYIDMKSVDSGSYVFARRGGHDMNYTDLSRLLHDRLNVNTFYHANDYIRISFENEEYIIDLCTRDDSSDVSCSSLA